MSNQLATRQEESAHPELWEGLDSLTDFRHNISIRRNADGELVVRDLVRNNHGILYGFQS